MRVANHRDQEDRNLAQHKATKEKIESNTTLGKCMRTENKKLSNNETKGRNGKGSEEMKK